MTTTNGTANGTTNGTGKQSYHQLREQLHRGFSDAIAAGDPDKARKLLESFLLWDSFGGSDLFDRVRPRQNDDGDATRWVPPSVPSDRRHGSQWPVWRTQTELDQLRQQARLRMASNSYAQGLLENRCNNVIGKGYAYDVEPILEKGKEATPEDEQFCKQVQAFVDEFLNINEWNGDADNDSDEAIGPSREQEIYCRVEGDDGECFIRCHFRKDGTTLTRFLEPEQIRDEGGTVASEGWFCGIRHQMEPYEDVQVPLKYSVFWPDPSAPGGEGGKDGGMFQEIDADEVVHVKGRRTPSTVARGLSRFLFDVGAALDRAAKGQRNASLGAGHRAATAEIWQHATATKDQITNLQRELSYPSGPDARGQTQYSEPLTPPAVRRIPAGQELVDHTPDNSASYLTAFKGDLQQAASAFCAPAFWLGDTENANYSNLESASAPAVRAGEAEQEYFKKVFRRVIWKAVRWAEECGKLPAGVKERVTIAIEAPDVLHRNSLEEAQEDQIGIQMEWIDRQTCAEKRGLDYNKVKQRNDQYKDEQMQQMAAMQELALPAEGDGKPGGNAGGNAGGKPPGTIPGAPQLPGGAKPPPPPKPAAPSTGVKEGFDPAEPRDTSGEWTGGGGGGGTAAAAKDVAAATKETMNWNKAVRDSSANALKLSKKADKLNTPEAHRAAAAAHMVAARIHKAQRLPDASQSPVARDFRRAISAHEKAAAEHLKAAEAK